MNYQAESGQVPHVPPSNKKEKKKENVTKRNITLI